MPILRNGFETLPSGQAVFLRLKYDFRELRKATVRAVRMGCPAHPFVVTHEAEWPFAGAQDVLLDLGYHGVRAEVYADLEPYITGETDGAYRCASIWDSSSRMGMLVHCGDEGIVASAMPLVRPDSPAKEQELVQELTAMAAKYEGCHVRLADPFSGVLWSVPDVLRIIRDGVEREG